LKFDSRKRWYLILSSFSLYLIIILTFALTSCAEEIPESEEFAAIGIAGNQLTWPTDYKDNGRTGRSELVGPHTPDIKWIYEAGVTTYSWAVIGKDGNIVSSFGDKVVCANPSDGTLAWEFSTQSSRATTCCVGSDGTIYVSGDETVHALTPAGAEKWSFDMGSVADKPTFGPDSTIYVGSAGGRLVALTNDGKLKWNFQVPGNIHSPSIDRRGNLYCGASPFVLYAFDKTGKLMWELKPEGDLPLYEGIYAWSNSIEIPSIGDDGTIYAGTRIAGAITMTGQQIQNYAFTNKMSKIYAVSPQGQMKWELHYPQSNWGVKTPSIGRDGTLYSGTDCWKVLAVSPNGKLLWEFVTGEGYNECPAVYSPSIGKDGLLYAATSNAKIFCITPNGTEKWRYVAGNPWLPNYGSSNCFTPPPIGDDGTLYSNLGQGRIYAFKAA
jgi:outer membrane protein assembly factor BamB